MYECGTCYLGFRYREDCDAHMDNYDHWIECDTCTRQFRDERSCEQHMDALDHWAPVFECETCTRTFSSQDAANQHMNVKNHWQPTVPCETCSQMFYTEEAANQHMAVKGHYKNYCAECDRTFMNENCLRQHLNSRIHRGTDIVCPFCNAGFVTASGVTHHVESGSCPNASKWNRDTIHRVIHRLDPKGIITNKQIERHNEQNIRYYATDRAFNGKNWECYLCRKGFGSMAGLNAHLNSSVHKEKIYHCLNKRGCGKEFVSLAALFNHLESESCGYIRFGEVQNMHRRLNDAIMNRKMITSL
ncbi:unnamed protein product [Penicillium nalgiovense]|uniref:C2H2-type domain-containing protein n=1 Tax=Penicillium nalgiovense TaxID=60175 RepID=A0A1V6YPQ0_PENNA|nr:hypothetical protein PENNAL_c0014G03086 [Penicillium nalgiovense]CAG7966521.1 unnamed protein product [Penicillium nalgiovense]CAG8057002.1 unnamed protein product [Penicillium nalgiovense]CAG8086519.1 unnamed protein product [Penicillium nalgiovense]CAG8122231.1 unnamed protein product [Penicillium nalgiovense]